MYKYFVHYKAVRGNNSVTEGNSVIEIMNKLNDLDRIRITENDIANKIGAKSVLICNFLRMMDE